MRRAANVLWEMHNCFSSAMLWPQTWRYMFPITRLSACILYLMRASWLCGTHTVQNYRLQLLQQQLAFNIKMIISSPLCNFAKQPPTSVFRCSHVWLLRSRIYGVAAPPRGTIRKLLKPKGAKCIVLIVWLHTTLNASLLQEMRVVMGAAIKFKRRKQ